MGLFGIARINESWKYFQGDDEPNNHNGREDCVEATFYPGNIYWNDLNCDSVRNWVCKVERGKDLVTPATFPAGTLSPQICGSDVDWVAYTNPSGQQKCYYFGNSPVQSWHQSNTYCQSLGGSLVSITSLDEQQFITGRASKTGVTNLWIGLVQDTMNGPFLWVDGSPVVFENWQAGGQPNDNFGQELCVEAAASNARSTTIDLRHGWMVIHRCSLSFLQNWLPYGSKCFLEVGFTDQSLRSNWEDSEAYCESNNGFLASITNEYYSGE
ncbi:unnamed protein product [Clavelina lepadiformis]|uniref:C-type lectin domain-containing protein n=1 Tax=Clavelina lepadiformis TaxID=159417 RepID=A0ABP0FRY1_CLALP